jgi:glycosyltransferase involved in cell wall biosynthesis
VFLGRLDRCKGAHTAIAVARRLQRRLIIAGNISTLPHEREYYEREIAPHVDGDLVTYIGEVDDDAKSELLRKAAALLMPVEWEEPFGIVIVEALMSGTPVIAFRRGGIPEILIDGRTGLLCDTVDEMVACVERLPSIERAACRADAERRFSNDAVVSAYEGLYEEMIGARG